MNSPGIIVIIIIIIIISSCSMCKALWSNEHILVKTVFIFIIRLELNIIKWLHCL
jgi:hypothetical protein